MYICRTFSLGEGKRKKKKNEKSDEGKETCPKLLFFTCTHRCVLSFHASHIDFRFEVSTHDLEDFAREWISQSKSIFRGESKRERGESRDRRLSKKSNFKLGKLTDGSDIRGHGVIVIVIIVKKKKKDISSNCGRVQFFHERFCSRGLRDSQLVDSGCYPVLNF